MTKPGTDMVCDMIRPVGMSRPVGTAMQTKHGTDMIRHEGMRRPKGKAMSRPELIIPGTNMFYEPEGMSRTVGTAMQIKPKTGMICDMIRPEGTSRPEDTAMQTKPGTAMSRPEMAKRVWPRAASTAPIRAESALVPKGRDAPGL
jgi:hypothetical protein